MKLRRTLEKSPLRRAPRHKRSPGGNAVWLATRVVARWRRNPRPLLAWLWQKLALRVLGAVLLVLVMLAAPGFHGQ